MIIGGRKMNADGDMGNRGITEDIRGRYTAVKNTVTNKVAGAASNKAVRVGTLSVLASTVLIGGYVLINSSAIGSDNTGYSIKDRVLENGCLQSFYETNFGQVNHLDTVCSDGTAYRISDTDNNLTADIVAITRLDGDKLVTETFRAPKVSSDAENPTAVDSGLKQIIDDSTKYLNDECIKIFELKTSTMYKIIGK
jgi:hypothetical protein